MLEKFNLWHIVWVSSVVAVFVLLTVLFAVFYKNKNQKAGKWVVFALLTGAFVLHFLRLVWPSSTVDYGYPQILHFITPESICAINAMIFPFFFLFGSKAMRDYMVYVGIFTFVISMAVPTVVGNTALEFDTWRFFIMHAILAFAPIMMCLCGHHRIDWKRVWKTPFVFIMVLVVVFANEVVLTATGLVDQTFAEMFSLTERNIAMVFGPTEEVAMIEPLLNFLTPEIFRTAITDVSALGLAKGDVFYWPIFWIVIPGLCLFLPLFFLMALCFDARGFWFDIRYFFLRLFGKCEKAEKLRQSKKLRDLRGK